MKSAPARETERLSSCAAPSSTEKKKTEEKGLDSHHSCAVSERRAAARVELWQGCFEIPPKKNLNHFFSFFKKGEEKEEEASLQPLSVD